MTATLTFRAPIAVLLAAATAVAAVPLHPGETFAQEAADFAIPEDADVAAAAALRVDDEPPAPEDLPTLVEVRDGAAAQADLLPAAEWEIDQLALALAYDPDSAFAFVRDRIAFDPYAGALRGAEGTLAARAGNAWDRAILLAAILEAMGIEHRFAIAELDETTADRVLERAATPPVAPLPMPGIAITGLDAEAIRTRATRDYARLREALGDRVGSIPGPDVASFRDAVRQHAWVQAAHGTAWRDLDPTLADAEAGTPLVAAADIVPELPDDAWHTVTLRAIAGTVAGTGLEESLVLERTFRAAEAASADIFVSFLPYDPNVGAVITQALSGQDSWVPLIVVETDVATGTPFGMGGRGTDVFGEGTTVVELATLRLEIERRAPGDETSEAVRIILDRRPEGSPTDVSADELTPMPGDETGPYALRQFHHVMVSTGGTDRREYAIERSAAADFVGTSLESDLPLEAYGLPSVLWPVAVADRAAVVASETAVVPSLGADGRFRAFVSEPRVTVMSAGRDAADGTMAYGVDLLIDDVALLPTGATRPGEAAERRIWYGALQTALETEIAVRRAALLDPGARTISGVSMAAGALSVLPAGEVAAVPPGSPVALRDDVDGGSIVIVPGDPVGAPAWWTVDPESGATRSILDPGLGGAVPRGPAAPLARVLDSSYTHGAGARLPPRPPMVRPPGGGTYTSPRAVPATCGPSDSGGYVATISCVSIPAAAWWVFAGLSVAALGYVWFLILTT